MNGKLIDYKSPEKEVLLEVFDKIPMMDKWIATLIESYIYSYVEYTDIKGQKLVKYRTKYGLKDGEFIEYHSNGNISVRQFFVNDKLQGEFKRWYEDGQLHNQTNYKDGLKEGEYKVFYKTGNLAIKATYFNGELNGEYIGFYDNGKICEQCTYVDNKLVGEYIDWKSDGTLWRKTNYVDGKKNGEHFESSLNGYIYKFNYEDDKLNGKYNIWFPGEIILKIHTTCLDNNIHGEYKEWYNNGQQCIITTYKHHKLDGDFKKWDEDGNLIYDDIYDNGVKIN